MDEPLSLMSPEVCTAVQVGKLDHLCTKIPICIGIFNSKFFTVFLQSKFPPKAALQFAICKSYIRNFGRHPDTGNDNMYKSRPWPAVVKLLMLTRVRGSETL